MKSKKLISITIIILAFICIFVVPSVLAGDGDGSGGGSEEGLFLVSSSPASGQTDVSVSSSIDLEFSKNVVNMTVKDQNSLCFKLYQGQQNIAISVIMSDDQIEPEKKRLVSIVPQEPLQSGTVYTLRISPDLTSKSGVSLGKETVVSFTTAGAALHDSETAGTSPVQGQANAEPHKVQDQNEEVLSEDVLKEGPVESSSPEAADESEQIAGEEENSPAIGESESPAENGTDNPYIIWLIGLIGVLCSLGIYIYLRKRSSTR